MKTLKLIQKIKEKFPELRIGQILTNACYGDVFYATDKDLESGLQRFIDTYLK